MKKLFKKLLTISKKLNKDNKNKKLHKKMEKTLILIAKEKDKNKLKKNLNRTSNKFKKYNKKILNKKEEKLLTKIISSLEKNNVKEISKTKENSSVVNNFWNELAITQMAAGRPISVVTEDMRKSMNGDKKATEKIKSEIDVTKAAYKGFFYRGA